MCKIPEQWKVAKIIPIFKKGSKVSIENYRPIANLCSASKVFEKLILKQIQLFIRIESCATKIVKALLSEPSKGYKIEQYENAICKAY